MHGGAFSQKPPTLRLSPSNFLCGLLFPRLRLNTPCSPGSMCLPQGSLSLLFSLHTLSLRDLTHFHGLKPPPCAADRFSHSDLSSEILSSWLLHLEGSKAVILNWPWTGARHLSLVTPNLQFPSTFCLNQAWIRRTTSLTLTPYSSLIFKYYPFISFSPPLPFQAISKGFSSSPGLPLHILQSSLYTDSHHLSNSLIWLCFWCSDFNSSSSPNDEVCPPCFSITGLHHRTPAYVPHLVTSHSLSLTQLFAWPQLLSWLCALRIYCSCFQRGPHSKHSTSVEWANIRMPTLGKEVKLA